MNMSAASGVGHGDMTELEMLRRVGLRTVLREDRATHRGDRTRAGYRALWVHRLGVYSRRFPQPLRYLCSILHSIAHVWCRNVYGIELELSVQVGRRMEIGHQHGIVIHKYARFGDDCVLRQGVTLGVGNEWIKGRGPVIGNNVSFGVGAVILGNVKIGDNVQIGPNCVVMNDVPANRSLFVSPPRVLPLQTPAEVAAPDAPERRTGTG